MSRRPPDDDDNPREQFLEGRPQPKRPGPPPRPDDEEEERPRRRAARREEGDEDDGYSGVVPYRNGFALASYYMGFLGLIAILGGFAFLLLQVRSAVRGPQPAMIGFIVFGVIYGLGGISGLLAIIFGGVGLSKASGGKKKGTAHAIVGIILGVLEIIGLVLIMLLGLVASHR